MDRRFIQLFKILAKSNDYIKSDLICNQLDIRPRTLRDDLHKYKTVIGEKAGSCIVSKPNKGYKLKIINENLYNSFIQELLKKEADQQYLIPVYQEERIQYIIRYFLSHNDYILLNNLADEIYVSRSTLNADIKEVKKRLSFFHLQLITRAGYGIKIDGKEKDIRACIAQYFYHTNNYDQDYIRGIDIKSDYIDQDAFSTITDILYQTIQKYEFKLTDFGFQNLTLHIFIAINRIMGKTYVEDFINQTDDFSNSKELVIANEIGNKLNNSFGIIIPDNEIHYIVIHLMGKQVMNENSNLVLNQETILVVNQILDEINTIYHIDFKQDFELYSMISLHIQPLINRLSYDLKISNPLTTQIKNDNPEAFEIAVLAGSVLSKIYNKSIDVNELGYLALHFALALERLKKPVQKNIIIVCASGAGSSQILLYKIKSKFKDHIDKILVSEAYELHNVDMTNYDYILSTIPLNIKAPIPIIQVQYFLDDSDINNLENILINNYDLGFVTSCFRENLFFTNIKTTTREETIQYLCSEISKIHKVPDHFYDLVLEREKVASTEFGQRTAIPHPIKLVMDETFVAIGILEKPIKWDKQLVKFVFLLCIKKDSDEPLTMFNEVLSTFVLNKECLSNLEQNPSFQTLYQHIHAISHDKQHFLQESIFQ